MVITVQLKNPPPEGDYWQLYVANYSKTDGRFIQNIPMNGIANFTNIPDTWDFPLFIILAVYQWVEKGVSAREVYYIQNYWGSGYPGYNELKWKSINIYGEWFFNFTSVAFEYYYKGTITKLQLKYDSSSGDIPVGEIPTGQGKIFANIRNDIIHPEVIGLHWEVKDPTGVVLEDYDFVSPEVILPGQSFPLMSLKWLPLTKVGKYTINIEMFMTVDRIVVDSYSGELCTIVKLLDVIFDELTVTPPEETLKIEVGQTIKVPFGFRYKAPETTSVKIWASLYKYSFGMLDRQGQAQTKETIMLEQSLIWKTYYSEINIIVGELDVGKYGLIVELPDYGIGVRIDNFAELSKVPPPIPPPVPPPEEEFPWLPVAIAGGAVIGLAYLAKRKK